MNIKPWNIFLILLLFFFGGYFAYTDPYEGKDIWTFAGGGILTLTLSIVLAWITNKILRISKRYTAFAHRISLYVSPVLILSVFFSLLVLANGLIEYF